MKPSLRIWAGCVLLSVMGALPVLAQEADKAEFSKWQFKLSGEERFRYEQKKDFDFNQSVKDNGGQINHRFLLGGKASLMDEYQKPKMDFYIEGLDAHTGGYKIKAVKTQVDDFDLHQAYVDLYDIGGSHVDVKLGRQEIKYGKGRIIGAPAWNNRMRSFDAGVVHYQDRGFYGDILYGQDVKYSDDRFNYSRAEEFVTGFYGGYQEHKKAPLLENYFFTLKDIKGTSDILRYTVGARLQMETIAGAVLDVEVPYQFGHAGTTSAKKDVKAYAFHADLSKNWEAVTWKPKVAVSYDEASGDHDPNDSVNNTFIPLYQGTHEAYGIIDFFRWQNVRNPELSTTFSPTDKFKFTPQADFFWLQSKFDSWYNSSGTAIRSKTTGDRGYFVGTELALRLYYDFNKHLKMETGYAHFFPGGFVKDSGADDDVDWVYSQLAFKF